MNKYVLTLKIVGMHDGAEPGDMGSSWYNIGEETLVSRVIDFPNSIVKGEKITLKNEDGGKQEISEVVMDVIHHIPEGYSILDLGKKESKCDKDGATAKKMFEDMVKKYLFLEKIGLGISENIPR